MYSMFICTWKFLLIFRSIYIYFLFTFLMYIAIIFGKAKLHCLIYEYREGHYGCTCLYFPLFGLWKVLAYMIACAVKFECKNNFKIYSVLDMSFEFASFDRNFCNWRFDGNDEAFLVSFFQISSDVYVFFFPNMKSQQCMCKCEWYIWLFCACLLGNMECLQCLGAFLKYKFIHATFWLHSMTCCY